MEILDSGLTTLLLILALLCFLIPQRNRRKSPVQGVSTPRSPGFGVRRDSESRGS